MIRGFCLLVFPLLALASVVDADRELLPILNGDPKIGSAKGALHVVLTTECNANYFVFQSLALKMTFDNVQQRGNLTRLMSCSDPDVISQEDLESMDTFVLPSWTRHPVTGDVYSPYNRPVGIIHWLAERKPTAEWTLIVDPDMFFRQPFDVGNFDIPEGYAMSSGYSYLVGATNALADRHIPHVERRNDTFGGPVGRRADKAGAYYLIRTRDLMKVAPEWLKYTEAVRQDPHAWNLTGDQYVAPGGKAWISEMYGYIFAAASAGIWHHIDSTIQYYPGYLPKDIPLLVHYGLNMKLGDYAFDKHNHFHFDGFACPPWNLSLGRKDSEDKGLFPHPPWPETTADKTVGKLYGQLMLTEVVNTLNQALCLRHLKKCPVSDQLIAECGKVDRLGKKLEAEFRKLHESKTLCHDEDQRCPEWAQSGSCMKNWEYMDNHCRASCNLCRNDQMVKSHQTADPDATALGETVDLSRAPPPPDLSWPEYPSPSAWPVVVGCSLIWFVVVLFRRPWRRAASRSPQKLV